MFQYRRIFFQTIMSWDIFQINGQKTIQLHIRFSNSILSFEFNLILYGVRSSQKQKAQYILLEYNFQL
ncbi:hypothetical protein pb186bvf_017851 [Paramecium bursaria]